MSGRIRTAAICSIFAALLMSAPGQSAPATAQKAPAAAPGTLSQDLVKKMIHESLYPASNDSDTAKTTLQFNQIDIAKPKVLQAGEEYGFAGGTKVWPVLAQFKSILKVQMDANAKPQFTEHDITQLYYFYKDDFDKWAFDSVASSRNRNAEKMHN